MVGRSKMAEKRHLWPKAKMLKKNFVGFLVDLKTPQFPFEIY